jgi:hypothetical protein
MGPRKHASVVPSRDRWTPRCRSRVRRTPSRAAPPSAAVRAATGQRPRRRRPSSTHVRARTRPPRGLNLRRNPTALGVDDARADDRPCGDDPWPPQRRRLPCGSAAGSSGRAWVVSAQDGDLVWPCCGSRQAPADRSHDMARPSTSWAPRPAMGHSSGRACHSADGHGSGSSRTAPNPGCPSASSGGMVSCWRNVRCGHAVVLQTGRRTRSSITRLRPATGRSVSRRTCQACTPRDLLPQRGHTRRVWSCERVAAPRCPCPQPRRRPARRALTASRRPDRD